MADPLSEMLASLNLTDTGARTREDIFTGHSQPMPSGRVFGGQVMAQALVAAQRTISPERHAHSMHGYFLRPGDLELPITFSVDRIHDGRSFSTRRTQAYQAGLPILSMIASFQDDDPGLDHQVEMPRDVPDPETLPSTADALAGVEHPVARAWAMERSFDVRHVPSPIYLTVEGERTETQAVWMKTVGPMPDDRNLHQAALVYASDFSIQESVLRRHGVPWATPGLKVASLDHAMWLHRPGRVDDWLLYVQESPTAVGGRGLGQGRIYTRDGVLIASVAQEITVRVPGF
ncbi:acyl-CoA thioesterase II [Leifsonia sp. H3M29-4]|uniref:acyl-CoA thioesterase n=1 Tax=Salinibacterium metalliresistens TaxID=3031321 RepID=UPI0023D9A85C|nr:acyl-CoA thioesterase II [Salinibacterium metalliresistens]MDF1478609.1 acyl-CoA thioesterase II [Salinibacterium metalliresistens]